MTRKSNPSRKDPSQTVALRRRAEREINKRFNAFKKKVVSFINENPNDFFAANAGIPTRKFTYEYDFVKVDEFSKWIKERIKKELLNAKLDKTKPSILDYTQDWFTKDIANAYVKSAGQENAQLGAAVDGIPKFNEKNIFKSPLHYERGQMLFGRAYTQLKGVTDAMAGQMADVLTDGYMRGDGVRKIAKAMSDRIDKVGKVRATRIARTEIINAAQNGHIVEGERLESVVGEPVLYEWLTTMDGREREEHAARNGKIYTREEVQALIGEPNCRCAVLPVLESSIKK